MQHLSVCVWLISFSALSLGSTQRPVEQNREPGNNVIGPLSYTLYENELLCLKDLNIRPETVKLLEENLGEKPFDTCLLNDFLDLKPKA